MKRCKVSVVTPTFGRPTLDAAIRSVQSQTLTDLELILVVDPWQPSAERDFQRWNDPRIRIVSPDFEMRPPYLPARVSLLRNIGIRLARGEYVAHLDDDNWWAPTHLQTLCELLDMNPRIGFAHSWRIIVEANGDPVPLRTFPWRTKFGNADAIFALLIEYGIAEPGQPYLRDAVIDGNGDELFHIDTSELCVRRSIHERFPFPVKYTFNQMIESWGEDRILCETLHRQGIEHSKSEEFTLFYRLGGFSNTDTGGLWGSVALERP